jgi:cyanate permease
MHPDVRLEVALNGAATRLAHQDAPLREAVAQLDAMANGRGDLLAAAAGSILGGYLSRPGSTQPQMVYAVALLVLAGADVGLIVEHVDKARETSTAGNKPRPQLPPK